VPVVRQALEDASTNLTELDAVAATAGPGLVGSLLVGMTYAKALCFAVGLPLVAVNHVEGHIYAVLLEQRQRSRDVSFPALALVVSGGHTHLFAIENEGQYRLLGKTRDDAAGEAYDKVAKLLGFGYPGGPILDRLASFGNPRGVKFTLARMKGNDLDFSFSGLKTAVVRWVEQNNVRREIEVRRQRLKERPALTIEEWTTIASQQTLDLIASFQASVIEELIRRCTSSADQIGVDTILISGGVACNAGLRARASQCPQYQFYFPSPALSTDNAAMIAAAAFPKFRRAEFADYSLRAQASLSLA
jgi:N6-L-threonylcarbamoyladenine synthase